MAARRLMPARIMTASWLVKFWMSRALGPKVMLKPAALPMPASAGCSARMNSPRARSCWLAAARLGAVSTPVLTFPAAFFDSYLYVGIVLPCVPGRSPGRAGPCRPDRGDTPRLRPSRDQHRAISKPLGSERTLELLRVRRLGDGVLAADVAVHEQLLDRAVQRLHAQGAAGLDDVRNFEN